MSDRTRTRPLAATGGLLLVVALALGACGSTASGSPAATGALPSMSASAGASTSASTGEILPSPSSTVAGVTAAPSGAMTGDQLVSAIPTQVGTKTLTVRTADPSELPLLDMTGGVATSTLLTALGVDASSVAAALGSSSDGSLVIGALSAQGIDTIRLQTSFRAMMAATGRDLSSSRLAGRSVSVVALPDGASVYVYTWGPTLLLVKSGDEAEATEALSKLPGPPIAG